jgi:hypothetical protein
MQMIINNTYLVRWVEDPHYHWGSQAMYLAKIQDVIGTTWYYFTDNKDKLVIHKEAAKSTGAFCGLSSTPEYVQFDRQAFVDDDSLGFEVYDNIGNCTLDHVLLHMAPLYSRSMLEGAKSAFKLGQAALIRYPSTAPLKPALDKATEVVQARSTGCDCGAHKAMGVAEYAAGHSSWCSVHESKKTQKEKLFLW